ncbi:MAG: hypothetical protein NZ750_06160 [Anaerolineae bacterium]|nr:hypothetical protein [Anaerolineae bacterium]MDW8171669.1 hypothetical protein [Anaerolineae bacterium]
MRDSLAAWGWRGLLAACLAWGIEVLLWTDLLARPLSEWLLRVAGYLLVASLLLDLAVRYRLRDLTDHMALLAIGGLSTGLLVAPQLAFADFPRTLVTRSLGAFTFLGFEMWALFLLLLGGATPRYQRIFLMVALLLGFFWGTWMRWTPEFGLLAQPVSPPIFLGVALFSFGLIVAISRLMARRAALSPEALRFDKISGLWFSLGLIALFLLRAAQGNLQTAPTLAVLGLIVVAWSALWFRRSASGTTTLMRLMPPQPTSLGLVVLGGLIFAGSVGLAYSLPLVGAANLNQLWVMELGFVLAGFAWFPVLAARTALDGVDQQLRKREL